MVLSYPAYCRYRSALKRLERCEAQYMKQAVVVAIGGRPAPSPNTRVVFCKDTFDYPELEDHQLLCNHLGQLLLSLVLYADKYRSKAFLGPVLVTNSLYQN